MTNKLIIYCDFDGTITKSDILDKIITDIYSYDKYKEMENKLLGDEIEYEQYLFDMFNDIQYDISNISNDLIDNYFFNFYKWIIENNIDFYIVSSGFKKIIEFLLPYIDSNIIYGNDIVINKNNKWTVKLFDQINNSSINKNDVIKMKNKKNYKTFFIGDGLSDFKVIGKVDYLLCKKDSILHKKCIIEKSDFIVYNDFHDIIEYLKKIVSS